jgi:AcrR family transcriptional regulator
MTATQRRERDRRQRHELIVRTARDLAEAEGWDAVTTRRLADRVEYSQPVLYSHFENRDAIVRAVALDGFADLAAELRSARLAASTPSAAMRAVAQAYLDFAAAHPALYEAMFILPIDVRFASPGQTPQPLVDSFAQLVMVVGSRAGEGEPFADPEAALLAEVVWGALHGLATLTRQGRMPPDGQPARLDLLLARLTPPRQDPAAPA